MFPVKRISLPQSTVVVETGTVGVFFGFFSEQLGYSAGNLVPGIDFYTLIKNLLPIGF